MQAKSRGYFFSRAYRACLLGCLSTVYSEVVEQLEGLMRGLI